MFMNGLTFAGSKIVQYNYTMEVLPPYWREISVTILFIMDAVFTILGILYYEYVSNNWLYIFLCCLFCVTFVLIYGIIFFYESPKFNYMNGKYAEARESLRLIAKFNGVDRPLMNFRFDSEYRPIMSETDLNNNNE